MLYELQVLENNCALIGDPVPLPLTDIINSNTNTNRLGKVRFEESNLATENDNQASTSTTNAIQQGPKTLPKSNNTIDKERVINIAALNPYMNKFVGHF